MKVGDLVEVEWVHGEVKAIGLITRTNLGFSTGHSHRAQWCWVAFPHKDMEEFPLQPGRLKLLTNKKNKNNIPT